MEAMRQALFQAKNYRGYEARYTAVGEKSP